MTDRPVARVAVDVPLAHLDRPFDYAVPDAFDDLAQAGVRVRVRFSGRLVDGYLLERVAESEHVGKLAALAKVVSGEPVLTAEVAGLARAVADRYAGTLADVLRLAVPPRHARVEAEPVGTPLLAPARPDIGRWHEYAGGAALLDGLAAGGAPRDVCPVLPGADWPALLATAVGTALAAERGVVVVVPDVRDLDRVDAALLDLLGPSHHVVLRADLGPAERYRRWLAVRRGVVRCAVGTRSAAFAPVADLGLVVVWDDGDDLHREPRAPYPHARDVLVLRAHTARAGALLAAYAPSVESLVLVRRGWAMAAQAPRSAVRREAAHISVAGSDADVARDPAARAARLPTVAWTTARAALAAGAPVLVQVPRAGYQAALACARCRSRARCAHCAGPLDRPTHAIAGCTLCGRPAADWRCAECGAAALRAVVTGSQRTAEELGRSFPGIPVRTSDRDLVLAHIDAQPCLVVATPGAEPVAEGGYGAVLLLDGAIALARPDLRAAEETLRRWCGAAALARSAAAGGNVVVMADAPIPAVQALIRWDPAGFAEREAGERAALGFPPATRVASVEGPAAAVADLIAVAELPAEAEVLGPVPHGAGERALVRVPWRQGGELAAVLHAALGVRSARKAPDPVRVELDPEL